VRCRRSTFLGPINAPGADERGQCELRRAGGLRAGDVVRAWATGGERASACVSCSLSAALGSAHARTQGDLLGAATRGATGA
jgi:hypothetical protein